MPNPPATSLQDVSTAAVNANLVWSYGYDGSGVGVVLRLALPFRHAVVLARRLTLLEQ